MKNLKNYIELMRLNKPIGIFLLLWPTLWALWLAGAGHPDPLLVLIFICGVVLMRSAGCVINDIVDRKFDPHVERTRLRPLARGAVTRWEAYALSLFLALLAFSLLFFLNPLTRYLALLGALFTVLYPFLKRWTHLPQLGLGVAFAWGVPMAFAAVTGTLTWYAGLVFLASVIWPIIYDTQYAMVDQRDDEKIGIKSTAILWQKNILAWMGGLQILFLWIMAWVGVLFGLAWFYYCVLMIIAFLFFYQLKLLQSPHTSNYFKAFLNNNVVGLLIFLGIMI